MDNIENHLGTSLLGQKKSTRTDVVEIATEPAPTTISKKKIKLYTRSVFIDGYYVLTLASSTGLFMCALWPLCESLGGNKIQLGCLVAIHAVGKGLFANSMAQLTEKYKHRHTLIVGCILLLVGSLLWAFSPMLGGLPMLYIAQFTTGIFCSTLGVARAFVVEQTRPNRRTHVLGRLSALEYAGHYVMPIFSAILVTLGATMSHFFKYALPAFALFFMGCVLLYHLIHDFQDIKEEDEMTEQDFNPVIVKHISPTPSMHSVEGSHSDVEKNVSHYSPPAAAAEGAPASTAEDTSIVSTNVLFPAAVMAVDQKRIEESRLQVYKLIIALNFTIRSCMAAYSTLAPEIILSQFDLSYFALGGLIAGAGSFGTLQFLGFKELWTSNFSDPMLLLIGFSLLGFSQIFVVNWNLEGTPKLWEFGVGLYAVMAIGFPIAISAALGAFSVLQRVGHQSNYHSHLMYVESAAHIIVPIFSGVLEECVRRFTTFSVIMILMAVSIIVVMNMYEPLMLLTDRTLISGAQSAQKKLVIKPSQLSLDNKLVRRALTVISTFLALAGVATFLISAFAGRV